MLDSIDILEDQLLQVEPGLLETLLFDHTTRKNIFWATDCYTDYGKGYEWNGCITTKTITGKHGCVIVPRALKSRDEQLRRSRQMAEIFTPSWIVKKMNDAIDKVWFSHQEGEKENKSAWQDYVVATQLEITCGEAPFLTSRYDAVSGKPVPMSERICVLNRKLYMVNENASDDEWERWALLALGSVYGYEWQGDNLLLAREALLATFNDYHVLRFGAKAKKTMLLKAAEIISWNIWQMDGLKAVVPYSCHDVKQAVGELFEKQTTTISPCPGCAQNNILLHNGLRCRLRRWIPSTNDMPEYFECLYIDFITKKNKTFNKKKWPMKFDFVIGNPPYNEDTKGTSDKPVYNYFMDSAYQVAPKVLLITPARFLFNAGKTPSAWNKKMLADKHLTVSDYYQVSSEVFLNTDIKGGVAITYHDETKDFGAIGVFTNYPELNSIYHKVAPAVKEQSLCDLFFVQNKFDLGMLYRDYPQYKSIIGSKGKERRLTASILYQLDVFKETKDNDHCIAIIGFIKKQRVRRYIDIKYLDLTKTNLRKWKVLVPKSNGSGALGEVLSTPMIGEPMIGYTQTFLGLGAFEKEAEAKAAYKYIISKFARTMLGILKITQDNPPEKWKYVPLQDFTPSSDIDWSKSVHEIDLQLYDKYGLTAQERSFIETHVKEMD